MIPIITRIMFSIPLVVISGSLLIESYFGIPGVGKVTYDAIIDRRPAGAESRRRADGRAVRDSRCSDGHPVPGRRPAGVTEMSAVAEELPEPQRERTSRVLWGKALYKFRRDRTGMLGLGIVVAYFVAALGVWFGLWGTEWSDVEGPKWGAMSAEHWFGTNIIGQDIFQRSLYSTKTAFEIGLIVAVLSTILGALLGALAGFFQRHLD